MVWLLCHWGIVGRIGTPIKYDCIVLTCMALMKSYWEIVSWTATPIKHVVLNYCKLFWFGLFGFYDISIMFGYLMPNPVFRCGYFTLYTVK